MQTHYRMTLAPLTVQTADEAGARVLGKALAQVGFIPNMYANMVHSPGLLNTYLDGYTAFRKESGFTPVEQEVVFLVLSRENGCDYCVSAHSFIADRMSGVPPEVTDAIRDDQAIPDERLQVLAQFVRHMHRTRGLPQADSVEAFLGAGYRERHILEIVLAIAVKTLSNYTNHLFQTPLDERFAVRRWQAPA